MSLEAFVRPQLPLSRKQLRSIVQSTGPVNLWTVAYPYGMCSIEGCDKPARARGWCVNHYARWKRHGSPTGGGIRGDDLARFWSKVAKAGADECWLWTGTIDRDGYGRFRMASPNRSEPAARTAWRLLVGPIPDGLQIDHVWARGCRSRACVNPGHLEPVTPGDNSRRGEPARRTHCPHGHEYTPENTSYASGTGRTCKTCNRARMQKRRQRLRNGG